MMINKSPLTYKKIMLFWLPLAATWLMMSVEGPFLAAIIARLGDAKYNLAAFGVSFSLGLMLEAPIIMLMSASIALVKNRATFYKLKKFTHILNALITIGMLILVLPQVFFFITMDLMGLIRPIADLTHIATILLLPWPAAIGYRRFCQGILIKNGQTRKVAIGTMVRLFSMGTTAFLLYDTGIPGAWVATSSLSVGVVMEAVATRILAGKVVKDLKNLRLEETKETLTYKEISKFYYPLALTPFIALSAQPFVTFFLGKSNNPIESLAIMPVVGTLTFIFRSLGLSFHEVAIALGGENFENYKKIRNFAVYIGLFSMSILCLITYTPLAKIWFVTISGLTTELAEFAILPAQIMSIIPALTVLISIQRAILVVGKQTGPISLATLIEVLVIFIVLFYAISMTSMAGAVAAASAFLIGRIFANIFLFIPCPKILRECRKRIELNKKESE